MISMPILHEDKNSIITENDLEPKLGFPTSDRQFENVAIGNIFEVIWRCLFLN